MPWGFCWIAWRFAGSCHLLIKHHDHTKNKLLTQIPSNGPSILPKKSLSHYSCRYLNISQVRTCLNQRRQKGSDNVQYLLVLSIKKVDLIKIYLHQSLSVLNWYLSLNEQFSAIDSLDRKKKKNRWNSLVKKLNLGWTH